MLHKWELSIPRLSPQIRRRSYLYLPAAYDEEPERRFPVLYMFDGQNVFLDSEASFGKSWGMYDYMNRSDMPLIIAAVESNPVGNGRLCEYSPFSHEEEELGLIEGRGKVMMDWLVSSFKPMIDKYFRTLPGREHTLIAGSSMGGLMSLYAATHYNHVFSRAACLSPSLWVDPVKSRKMLRRGKIAPDTVIYLDYGSQEIGNHKGTSELLISACQTLYAQGANLTFRIVPGGFHYEGCWQEQIPVFMKCLGL